MKKYLALLVAILPVFAFAAPAAADVPWDPHITSLAGKRCLDADAGFRGLNGTKVQLWDCDGWAGQDWTLVPIAPGSTVYQIQVGWNGKCLDADWNRINANGAVVQLWDCYPGSTNQQWTVNILAHSAAWTWGQYQIHSYANDRCLDADWGHINDNGTQVQLWDCYGIGSLNQIWSGFLG